jgi:hypothetical protein
MSADPEPVRPIIDSEARTITVALTVRWNEAWSIDKCEVGSVLGAIRNALIPTLIDDERVAGMTMSCYDPAEEVDLGYIADYGHPVCAGCGKPVQHADNYARAPEGWEHVDVIDADDPCDRLAGHSTETYVVRFPNLLDVDLGSTQARLDAAILRHRANPTEATHAAVMAAQNAHHDHFLRTQTIDYQRRTHA